LTHVTGQGILAAMRRLRALVLPLLALPLVAHADSKVCKAGALIFGDPTYKGNDKPNPVGQTVKQDPPLEWRGLVIAKGKVYTISGGSQEIWGGDASGVVKRLAGAQQPRASKFADGRCADVRFLSVRGIAALKNGALVVADTNANAIRTITDPEGPGCTVTTIVGPQAAFDDAVSKPPGPGDVDGAGKDAKLGAPEWVMTDDGGNIYFIDSLAGKLKKVAADDAHTVSTIGSIKLDKVYGWNGMTILDKKIYVVGNTMANAVIWEVDPAAQKVKVLKNTDYKAFPGLQNESPTITSIASDGTGLLISGQGFIWRMTKDGKTVTKLAGQGYALDYPPKYNPAGVYPVGDLALRFRTDDASSFGTSTFMVWSDNALYFRGRHIGAYVLKIGCP
jgi:hypothetical protein